jgi:hypothetical protein
MVKMEVEVVVMVDVVVDVMANVVVLNVYHISSFV